MRRLALVIFLAAAAAHAQVKEQITVERILIDVRVTNDSGDPILGLKAQDFRVKIDGKVAKVESAEWIPESTLARDLASIDPDAPPPKAEVNESLDQPAPRGRLLVFFFQTDFARNPSRAQGQQQILSMADKWLEWLEEDDRVAVFSFDSHLKFHLDFSSDKQRIKDAMVQALYTDEPLPPRTVPMPSLARRIDRGEMKKAGSNEAALIIVANALRSIPGPKSMILFGWGLGRYVHGVGVFMEPKYAGARYALERARVSVFSIDFTRADAHSLAAGLNKAAEDTGGFYASSFRFPHLALERLQRTLAGHYELEVRKPETKARGVHTIEVDVPKRRNAQVMARTSYIDSTE
jgi:VWFA-related protein